MSSVHAPFARVAPAASAAPAAPAAPAGAVAAPAVAAPATPTVDRLRYIAGRSLLTLEAVPGLRLRVEKGQVWITQAGRLDDHVLGPGDWLLPQSHGRMLVYAFEPAMVAVSMPAVAPAQDAGVLTRLGRALRAWLTPAWRTPAPARFQAGASPALCADCPGPTR